MWVYETMQVTSLTVQDSIHEELVEAYGLGLYPRCVMSKVGENGRDETRGEGNHDLGGEGHEFSKPSEGR